MGPGWAIEAAGDLTDADLASHSRPLKISSPHGGEALGQAALYFCDTFPAVPGIGQTVSRKPEHAIALGGLGVVPWARLATPGTATGARRGVPPSHVSVDAHPTVRDSAAKAREVAHDHKNGCHGCPNGQPGKVDDGPTKCGLKRPSPNLTDFRPPSSCTVDPTPVSLPSAPTHCRQEPPGRRRRSHVQRGCCLKGR